MRFVCVMDSAMTLTLTRGVLEEHLSQHADEQTVVGRLVGDESIRGGIFLMHYYRRLLLTDFKTRI